MVALTPLQPLNRPLITSKDVIDALKNTIPKSYNVPIYDEFPSDESKVRYGLYVSSVHAGNRTPYQLGIQYCGSIYNVEDTFEIIYVSYQQDPYEQDVLNIVNNLVTYQVNGVPFMDGYFERDYTMSSEYGPTRAEVYTWSFSLKRLNFNT